MLSLSKGKRGQRGLALRLGRDPDRARAAGRPAGKVNYLQATTPKWHTGLPTYGESSTATCGRGSTWSSAARAASSSTSSTSGPAPIRATSGSPTAARSGSRWRRREPAPPHLARHAHRHAPASYQLSRRQARARSRAATRSSGEGSYGFAVDGYDPREPLVIDPGLAYSTYLGGRPARTGGYGIAVDGAGSAYVTGTTHLGELPDDRGRLRHDLNGGAATPS